MALYAMEWILDQSPTKNIKTQRMFRRVSLETDEDRDEDFEHYAGGGGRKECDAVVDLA